MSNWGMTNGALTAMFIVVPVAAWPFLFCGINLHRRRLGWAGVAITAAGYAGNLVAALLLHQWTAAFLAGGALAAILAILGGWYRKNRKRAPRAYGAKSRALLAAIVRKAREAAHSRPVLRPQPGGAR